MKVVAGLMAIMLLAACETHGLEGDPEEGQAMPDSGAAPGIDGVGEWSGVNYELVAETTTVVARDSSGWQSLWNLVGEVAPGPLPLETMAVAILLDFRPTGGYGVEILSVGSIDGVIRVVHQELLPPPGAVTTQALTSPYVVRLVPASDLPVEFLQEPARVATPEAG